MKKYIRRKLSFFRDAGDPNLKQKRQTNHSNSVPTNFNFERIL